jgi:general secretion pathway protein D
VKPRALCLALAVLTAPAWTAAQQPPTVRINYVNADLGDVIRSLAAVLGVNVVLTDVPIRRITFQTPEPVPAPQVGAVLEAILESQGLVIVQAGPVAQVMPEEKRPSTGPVRVGKELPTPPPLGLVTQIVPLDYIRAEEGVTLLKQVASKTARVEIVPRSNSVLITDRGVSIARYLDLLRQLDVKTGGEAGLRTYVYPLKHASAAELATTLGQVFGATVAAAPTRQRVQALEGRSLSSELTGFRRREIQSLQERGQIGPPTVAAPPAALGGAAAEGAPAPGQGLVGRTTIVPDQATNSLVIRTAPPNFSVLQETIEELDIRPPQVLLEVLIAEVTLDRASQYGINWQLFTRRGIAGDSTRGIGIGVGPQTFGDTLLQGFQGVAVRIVSLASLNVRAILQALASRTNVRVLSTPRVLALNNEEARILVGSEVPFVSSTFSGLTAGLNTVVQFRNVGTQLTVVPTVNNDGYVTFRVLQEVSALSATTVAAALNAPVITTREAETSAIVKTGHTVVIGGLIGETTQAIESGVPILKDVPILGLLFKTRSLSRQRTELAIFLTPYVVYTDEQADSLLQRERDLLPNAKPGIDSMLPPRKP